MHPTCCGTRFTGGFFASELCGLASCLLISDMTLAWIGKDLSFTEDTHKSHQVNVRLKSDTAYLSSGSVVRVINCQPWMLVQFILVKMIVKGIENGKFIRISCHIDFNANKKCHKLFFFFCENHQVVMGTESSTKYVPLLWAS